MLVDSEIILGKPKFAEFFFNYFQVFLYIRYSLSNTVTVRIIQVDSFSYFGGKQLKAIEIVPQRLNKPINNEDNIVPIKRRVEYNSFIKSSKMDTQPRRYVIILEAPLR